MYDCPDASQTPVTSPSQKRGRRWKHHHHDDGEQPGQRPHDMATPQNRIIKLTRQAARNFGVDIDDLDQILTIQDKANEDDKMAEAALKMLTKQFNALSIKLDSFDGTANIEDFLDDIDDFCKEAGKESDDEKLACLRNNLQAEAKEWYRLQPTKTWAAISVAIKDRFGKTDQQKHNIKAKLFGATQQPSETFAQFVSRVQKMARDVKVDQEELVKICLNGARTYLRAHLQMASPAPDSIAALLKLPIVADETLQREINPGYEALVAEIASLNAQVATMSTDRARDRSNSQGRRVTFQSSRPSRTPRSHSRDDSMSRNNYRRNSRSVSSSRDRGRQQRSHMDYRREGYRIPSRSPYRPMTTSTPNMRCGRCSTFCPGRTQCRAWGKTCYKCNKSNHFARCCITGQTTQFQRQRQQ